MTTRTVAFSAALATLLTLSACDTPPCPQVEMVDASVDAAPPHTFHSHFYRLNTAVTFQEAEAACEAQGAELATAETVEDFEALFRACAVLPHPPPYVSPTCWTATWIEGSNGAMSV